MSDPLSFLVYVISPVFACILIFILPQNTRKNRTLLYLTAFAPICFFAALRGNVGTDTWNYRSLYGTMAFDTDYMGLMFEKLCLALGFSAQGYLASQAIICWVLFSIGIAHIDKKIPLVGAGLMPCLMIDHTFNTLRIGIGLAVFSILIDKISGKNYYKNTIFAALPGLFHSSLFLILVAGVRRWRDLVFVAVLTIIFIYFLGDFILSTWGAKFYLYTNPDLLSEPLPRLAGIFSIINIILFFYVGRKAGVNFVVGFNLFTISMLIIIISLFGSSFSYAFLRTLNIGIFILAISISRAATVATSSAKIGTVLLGILNIMNFLRILNGEVAHTPSPFLPYQFWV